MNMFSSKPKFTPGVPYEVQRVYDMLTPKPKELLMNASERRFINEGEVGVFNHKERRTKKRYIFLFSDVLLITKKEGKRSYWLKIFISLRSSIRIEDVPDSATRHKVEFRIYAPKRTIILFTQTEDQKLRWLREIKGCIDKRDEENVTHQEQREEPVNMVQISGDIGKIEIPGLGSDSYGDIPQDESSEEETNTKTEPEMISSSGTPPVARNQDLYGDVPLPATPNSTPVQGSMLDDFDSLANRNAPTFDPNTAFGNSTPLQPFASSTPLEPVMSPSNSILQPIPANAAPSIMQPMQNAPMEPTPQSRYDGFAALKDLDSQQQGGGNFAPQMQPAQMFTQMHVPPPGNVFNPNLSIEEQMQRLSMQSPYYSGN